jgi:hypothetical protein
LICFRGSGSLPLHRYSQRLGLYRKGEKRNAVLRGVDLGRGQALASLALPEVQVRGLP